MATQIQRKPAELPGVETISTPAAVKQRVEDSWRSITVDAPPEDCFRLWHDVANLPRFLSFVDAVEETDPGWSHWVGREGGERTAGWDAEMVEDLQGRFLEWRPFAGVPEATAVSVRFDPASRGTVVRLRLTRKDKADGLRAVRELHRFKQWKETGEIATTEGQPAGKRGPMGKLLRKEEQS
jgi:uncharacterized membrane protein